MSGFQVGQLAEVIVTRIDGQQKRGSGYQIRSDLVLTAAHVLKRYDFVLVRFDADQDTEWKSLATPVWWGASHDLWAPDDQQSAEADDVALLRLDQERDAPVQVAAFGRIGDSTREIPVFTAGFPRWKMSVDAAGRRYRDLHQATGTAAPFSDRRRGTLEITVTPPGADDDPDASPWEGMSGAAVWAYDRIIGVVAEHARKPDLRRLTGMRIGLALRDGVDRDGCRLSAVLEIDPDTLPDVVALGEASPQPPPVLPHLRAYRVPARWRPAGDPCPIGDAFVADLGAALCLDRGPVTAVVAGGPGTALAEALTVVEQGPIRHGTATGADDVRPRVWRGHSVGDTAGPPRRADPTEAAPGVVVRWPVGTYPDGSPSGRNPVVVWNRIRAASPDSPVVLLVEAEHPVDAIAAATAAARDVGAGPAGPDVEVYTLVRPGDPGPDRARAASTAYHESDAHRLMATVAAQMHLRSLDMPPYPWAGEPLGPEADPVAMADAVVAMLNRTTAWGAPASEARAVGLVRDYAPHCFVPLLRRHAARRAGSARWCSLAAAAGIDDHVSSWLDAAPVVGTPADVPRVLRSRVLVESVVLGLLRTGAPGLDDWLEVARMRAPAAWLVADFVTRGRPAGDFLSVATAEAAVAAARANRYDLLTGADSAELTEAWWAALGRETLTERTVARLAALSAESRRIAGFTAVRREPDPDFAELTHQMRTAMRPPLEARSPMR